MKGLLAVFALAAAVADPAAQTPTTAATPAKPAQTTAAAPAPRPAAPAPRAPAAPKATSVRVSVKDQNGAALADVRLLVTGVASGEFTTGLAGTAIIPIPKAGMVRVRCEHEGFVTLEREFTVGSGAWNPVDVTLTEAPPPAPPPPPAKPAPEPSSAAPVRPSGPPIAVSIPDFVDKNFIGRNPLKESVLACKPMETVRVLQMRETIAQHVHDRIDEVLYVVAGEGSVRIGDDDNQVRPGSLVFVPNGSSHNIEPRGKNPLIVLSTLVGSSCDTVKTTP
jgi:Cupin domain